MTPVLREDENRNIFIRKNRKMHSKFKTAINESDKIQNLNK